MNRTILLCASIAACIPSLAFAAPVYPGCASPTLKAGHHTFYVDPAKGTDAGDGSAAKPWRSLQSIVGWPNKLITTVASVRGSMVTINPNAPIKPGDVIMLMTGNYGNIKILNLFNTDFITIMPAPGQTPVIPQLSMGSSAKWVFQGIKFQGASQIPRAATTTSKGFDTLVNISDSYLGPTTDIVFSNDSFSTTDDTSKWSASDWILNPTFTAFNIAASCVSVSSSHFYNLFNAMALQRPKILAQGNNIEKFSNDAIDITASNITILQNTITNGANDSALDGQHADAIQGWSSRVGNDYAWNRDVVIDGNIIEKTGDPNKSYLQGISIFDGNWDNLQIRNNVVANNTYNGIVVFGAQNSGIINNTVVATNPSTQMNMIRVAPAKTGRHSTNVTVRNNIASNFAMSDTGITYDHNLISAKFMTYANGQTVYVTKSDTTSKNEIISNASTLFQTLNLSQGIFDLRLRPGSNAIAAGSPLLAPPTDVTGRRRSNPVDLGAYAK